MDRKWMNLSRTSLEYSRGVEEFVRTAIEHKSKTHTNIRCPCRDCNNLRFPISIDELRAHLLSRGFVKGYTRWTWHGETCEYGGSSNDATTHANVDSNIDRDEYDGLVLDSNLFFKFCRYSMSDQGESQLTQTKKRRRGLAKGRKFAGKDVIAVLEWKGNCPCGNHRSAWAAYCGILARNKVRITYESWPRVPNGLKETLWLDVQSKFVIPNEKRKKGVVLIELGKAWKQFRKWIRDTFIFNDPPPGVRYPYEIGIVSREDFEEYKKMVTTPAYEEKRKRGKENKKHDKYPHHLGATAYVNKIPLWTRKGLLDAKQWSNSGDADELFFLRPDCWKLARMVEDENGELVAPNEDTKKMCDRVDEYKEKENNAEFEATRTRDALTCALGKDEHGGHLRGVGSHLGVKDVLGSAKRNTGSFSEDNPAFMATVQKAVEKIMQTNNQSAHSVSQPDINLLSSSHSASHDPLLGLEGIFECHLALIIDGKKVIVAEGTANMDRDVVHTTRVSPENVYVTIDRIQDSYREFALPCPSDFLDTLSSARASFTQWPRHLVIPKQVEKQFNDVESSHRPNDKPDDPKDSSLAWGGKCALLNDMLKQYDVNQVFWIQDVQKLVLYEYLAETSFSIIVEDMRDSLFARMLDVSALRVFMLGMKMRNPNCFDNVAMVDPAWVSSTIWMSATKVDAKKFLGQFIHKNFSKRYILIPYHIVEGRSLHWILLVVNTQKGLIAIFEPLPQPPTSRKLTILTPLQGALLAARNVNEARVADNRSHFRIVYCQGARQPVGTVLCGYYVMRYMYDIIMHQQQSHDNSQTYRRIEAFSQEELEVVLDVFAGTSMCYV